MDKLKSLICEVFRNCAPEELNGELIFAHIPGWDSLKSIDLVLAAEKTYDVDLSDFMLMGNHTVNYFMMAIQNKIAKK